MKGKFTKKIIIKLTKVKYLQFLYKNHYLLESIKRHGYDT